MLSELQKAAKPLVEAANRRQRAGWERIQRKAQERRNEVFDPKARVRRGPSMDIDTYVRGVAAEGAEAMRPGSSYMRDMGKRFPWLRDEHDLPQPEFKATSWFDDATGKWLRRGPDGRLVAEDPPRRDWTK